MTGLSWNEFHDLVEQYFPSQQAVASFLIRTDWTQKSGETNARFTAVITIGGVYGSRERVIAVGESFEAVINEVKLQVTNVAAKRMEEIEKQKATLAKEERLVKDKIAKDKKDKLEEDKTRGINTTATTDAFSEEISAPRVKPEVAPEVKTEPANSVVEEVKKEVQDVKE